jgi:two-component system nitrogen regulation response regulator NtrX
VLITGESGTGKELVASAIHEGSKRRDRPFIRVNCAAIPRDLVESEMFGHERGAFTGATQTRIGKFELANTGTLFLDEVGDLSAEAQAKLLRAIESQEIQRVGGSRNIRVDVRVVAATNHDLQSALQSGEFREDLYFRLAVLPVSLPPLRERGEDVESLVEHFSALYRKRTGQRQPEWRSDAIAAMRAYKWPGNVRELANIVERLAILHPGERLTAHQVREVLYFGDEIAADETAAPPEAAASSTGSLNESLDRVERSLILKALNEAQGNVARAARNLETDRANLYRRMRRLGITEAPVES